MRRSSISRSRFAAFVAASALGITALAVSGATSQTNTAPPANTLAPPASDLIKVPVTKILPGDVDLTPKIVNPVADDPAAAARGMKYFANFNCIGCHADNGGGGMGPALSNRFFVYGEEPQNIYLTISQGRPNGMPAWGALLPSVVIWDLVAYVKSISDAPKNGWGKTISIEAMKIEQVPAEFQSTPDPWKYTQPFTHGQKPGGG
jgi:cytochrome c oxidase cbb3-type subunit III